MGREASGHRPQPARLTIPSNWETIRDVTSSDPFLLKDGTGACIVFPADAEVTFTDRSVWFGPRPIPEDKNPLLGVAIVPAAIAVLLLRLRFG